MRLRAVSAAFGYTCAPTQKLLPPDAADWTPPPTQERIEGRNSGDKERAGILAPCAGLVLAKYVDWWIGWAHRLGPACVLDRLYRAS